MPQDQRPDYGRVALLTALGVPLLAPALFVDGVSTGGRWFLVSGMVWLTCIAGYALWRARQ